MQFKKDYFLEYYLDKNCYITKNKNYLKNFSKLKTPFFATYLNKVKLSNKEQIKFNCKHISKLLIFNKKFKEKETVHNKCRVAKISDKKKIDKLVLKTKSNSRFYLDPNIDRNKIKRFRADWVARYFENKKRRKLILCEINNKIQGILLIRLDKKNLRIEIILVNSKSKRKQIASSLISYTNNSYLNQIRNLIAGTQHLNDVAINFYKKNKFKIVDYKYYHHIYSI